MDNNASIYTEKKLAYFESTYRESVLSKPVDVNITITPDHIFGLAYICEQKGTKEDDPTYMRFTCGLAEITKIYINNNNRSSPIYIQCDDNSKSVMNRRRIILPCFSNNDEIVRIINDAKKEVDKKLENLREAEKAQKIKELESRKRAEDDEFEKMTSGYEALKKPEKPAEKDNSATLKKEAPKPAVSAPAPSPAPKAETAPKKEEAAAPAPAPAPKAEAAPKPAPAPAPAPKTETAPKPAPAPAPAAKAEDETAKKGSVTVEDILELDDILGIRPEEKESSSESLMDTIDFGMNDAEIDAMSEAMVEEPSWKSFDRIETVQLPQTDKIVEPKVTAPVPDELKNAIEDINPIEEIAKKRSPKPEEPKHEYTPVVEDVPENTSIKSGADMPLEDFETAVKKLKSMLDNGVITESEFAQEKRKLLKLLY